ncbi:AtzE family amidohydrolase [Sphingomonas naphthae]|uniref:AtzE family amidohydrolase n=1 Tax=Sphingomonas naphthae TaxID=1813468 RepID=A0ABY7TL84_9SPHN|nr:AtzE family amidohydrolase [Sphingomonas naphthae]WCT73731.1 AtzE family amidohydrolase [Sphingomonas naphthae]
MSGARSAIDIAAAVRSGRESAVAIARATLADIAARDPALNAFTRILEARALADAARVDAVVAAGGDPGPLAGVPFATKDLFDVAGEVTTAGSAIRADAPPAAEDAPIVATLAAAGAVLVGTTVMDEFAYGFATENAHHGRTLNPHDRERLAGGSSGGSAAAVAAGLVPLSLGSDTNGSIRVPASLCGIHGLRPTQGGAPGRHGSFPFVAAFDTVGPFTRTAAEMALVHDVLTGATADPAEGLRVGRLTGWFEANADPAMLAGVAAIGAALGGSSPVELPEAARCRAAAFLISACEAGNLHLPTLRTDALGYDPAVRDRLIAGALTPAAIYLQAQRFRAWARERMHDLFDRFDLLLAPAVVGPAPRIADGTILVDGKPVPARANLGLYTQPLTLLGVPVLAVPLRRPGALPLGIQLIAAPGREGLLMAVARRLEAEGVTGYSAPARA